MQYRHEIGARSRYARPCEGEDSSSMKHAQMQYRHEIEHASANLALQRY